MAKNVDTEKPVEQARPMDASVLKIIESRRSDPAWCDMLARMGLAVAKAHAEQMDQPDFGDD